ncbi:AidA/PixA family protein [Melittangium boletus]|uniref:Inclusion body protein n=1 Tax=Melittangium boletus DSM 14713 TaxID=1294270 RepID=A0A250IHM8_9BACT|nr:AidA/PixA family protein [Melittangium boletus]ATB30733.1 hypothetical protein MEBOL_004194 [Melittangium boletus DSM 14713]
MADPEKVIDILVAIDAKSIMDQFGGQLSTDAKSPTSIGDGSKLVYMFVRWDEVISGDGTSTLNVSNTPSNVIRWRGTSMTMNSQLGVTLHSCELLQGDDKISQPEASITEEQVPFLNRDGNPDKQTLTDLYFESTSLGSGKVVYAYTFAITDDEGKLLGYFKWGNPGIDS